MAGGERDERVARPAVGSVLGVDESVGLELFAVVSPVFG
jgi:hypothetical protein